MMKKWLLALLLLAAVAARGSVTAQEDVEDAIIDDDEDEDEADASAPPPPSADGAVEKGDSEEEDELKPLEPSADVETVVLFTQPPVSPKELPSSVVAKFLINFYNKGDKEFTVDSLETSFRYPMDYSFYIQNYTTAVLGLAVAAGEEASFDYAFVPADSYAGRPFGLVALLNYHDADGAQFQNAVFNETVNIVEQESAFNPETGFLYVVFACIVVLLLVLGQQFLSKMRRKHGMSKKPQSAPVEMGTANKHEVDFGWIPKEILQQTNKSPRASAGGKSPRQRKTRRAGGDD